MYAIETQSLTKQYGDRCVVDEINLKIESGTVFGFLGPNGAGKTTTIRLLLGLVRASRGSAKILDMDVATEFAFIAPKIGSLAEAPAFFPNLTAIQTLRVFSDYAQLEISTMDLNAILDTCGILYAEKWKIDTFSLGMKQRLALALALLNDPQVIFLDEPSNGLDPDGITKTRKLIRGLAERGKTVFMSSHLLSEVEQICDQIAILDKGRIKACGNVATLIGESKFYIRASPVDGAEHVIKQVSPGSKIDRDETGQVIYAYVEPDKIPEIVRGFIENGISVSEVRQSSMTVEDLFHQTVDSV